MKNLLFLSTLTLVGCGAVSVPEVKGPQQAIPGEAGPSGPVGPQGVPGPIGPQGPPGEPGATFLLSYGTFAGLPPAGVISSGGPVGITSFTRFGDGDYRITYDVLTSQVGVVAITASAFGTELDSGINGVGLVGAAQDPNATFLTVDVISVASFVDDFALVDSDTLFSLVIHGQ